MDTAQPRWWIRAATPTDEDREALAIQLFDFDVEAIVEDNNFSDIYFTERDEAIRCADALRIDGEPQQSASGSGEVFGQTEHPTTQLLLDMLYGTIFYTDWVADIGSGSGRLSVKVEPDARRVVAVDIDWPAVRASKRVLNYMHAHVVQGSADCLASNRFDVVLANLHLAVWRQVAPEIARIATPEARLFASGFLADQESEVRALMAAHGWTISAMGARGGWLAIAATRQG